MKITTKKGYAFFEATSAFQKAIRRGEEETAIYFAVEFFNSGYEEYAWKRMKIIASEDIGLAEPDMPARIAALYQFFQEGVKDKKENRPERMYYIHAVLLLVRAKKSRLVDWVVIAAWRDHEQNNMSIPDYAYDMHNLKGKQMGRGLDHFYDEGTRLENHTPQYGETYLKLQAKTLHEKYPGKLKFEIRKKGTLNQQTLSFNNESEE